jgi:predicted MarR family transcription regulator
LTNEEKITLLEDRYLRHTSESNNFFKKWQTACLTIARVLQREGGVTDAMAEQIERYHGVASDALADALAEARKASDVLNALAVLEHLTNNN